jgi:malate dehydrogenase (oxaloacetate-decarboxylating)(NADP+)
MQHTEDVLPYIYTPTVGEACQRYHALPGMKVHGLYITLNDKVCSLHPAAC